MGTSVQSSVAVVIPTFNHAEFLSEAIESCIGQTLKPDEILVVDDGSTDSPETVVASFPQARILHQGNRGLAAARNTGLAAVSSEFVCFLDADDRFVRHGLEAGVDAMRRHPGAVMVYGAHRYVDERWNPTTGVIYVHETDNPYLALVSRGNFVSMHAAVLYRRESLLREGGFDELLRTCEDFELYLRIARRNRIASHDRLVAEYRIHGANMSSNKRRIIDDVRKIIRGQLAYAGDSPGLESAVRNGVRAVEIEYGPQLVKAALQSIQSKGLTLEAVYNLLDGARMSPLRLVAALRKKAAGSMATLPRFFRFRSAFFNLGRHDIGMVDFGDLDRITPFSRRFGFDRGQPVDRVYIEEFLTEHAQDIRGKVLEVGDDTYTRRFGGAAVSMVDILDVSRENKRATIIGSLECDDTLDADEYDCIVFTQTLHLVFDMQGALRRLTRALKPGGVLLVTVPGITPIDANEFRHCWYWSLTEKSLRRMAEALVPAETIQSRFYGNVYAATAFLHGLAASELDQNKLKSPDPSFPVIVSARIVKPASL